MPLFRRETAAAPDAAAEEAAPPKNGGKGRPTPKRKDAERARRSPLMAPSNRREAYKSQRAETRARRRQMRHALATGDERNLPPRDAGPARRYVRDLVDGRRNAGSLFLPAALLLLFASSVRLAAAAALVTAIYLVLLVWVAGDCFLLSRRAKREVASRFGEQQVRGVGMYAIQRSLQLRRLRMPPPKVKRGEPPRP